MGKSARLGPFDVGEQVGEGGMGAVYRGEHVETGVPVAIKAIRRAGDRAARRRFHAEIQAHAGLQHPGIVYLFDYGEIDPASLETIGHDFAVGDPYVAMELADLGSVRDMLPLSSWESVRNLLVDVLDALAHSHARGLVHRDLKPENFLVFESDETGRDWRAKLADFGIAHAFRRERYAETAELESPAGTPYYMAPEQLHGKWRNYGPWTDLYALGCIAWELVSGRPPFPGDSFLSIAVSHEQNERPPLEPQFPIPDALEDWIHRAMAVDQRSRFARAADAAHALPRPLDTGETERQAPSPSAPPTTESTDPARLALDATTLPENAISLAPTATFDGDQQTALADTSSQSQPTPRDQSRPPVPADWRIDGEGSIPAPLLGTGLGLFGLREPPFVNRRDACDRIWESLRGVVEEESLGMMLVAGEAGTGKSRLVEWITRRAHEVGAARVLRAVHTSGGGPGEGLRGALDRALRTVKMDRREVFEHLRDSLPNIDDTDEKNRELDAAALTEYLRPTDDDSDDFDGPSYRFSNPDQKRALVARILERLSRQRPIVLWLDDLQWGGEALGLVEHLVESSEPRPAMLILGTVRSDLEREHRRFQTRLADLETAGNAERLQLEPLSRRHQRMLLTKLLPLEDDLADTLAERTEGHPLFAMQLLGNWIEQSALEVGANGFRLSDGSELELPADIHGLWLKRLSRFVEDRDSADGPEQSAPPEADAIWLAVERAALLGREVAAPEWRAVCDELEIEHAARLRDRLIERGLARRSGEDWSFSHGLFVDSLERHARTESRWREHHRSCAELLAETYPDRRDETASRRANHWIEASRPERAITPLLVAHRQEGAKGDFQSGVERLSQIRRLLDQIDAPPEDERRLETEIRLGLTSLTVGKSADDVLQQMQSTLHRAADTQNDLYVSRACRVLSRCHYVKGDVPTAIRYGERALKHARKQETTRDLVHCLGNLGGLELDAGSLEKAETYFAESSERAREAGRSFLALKGKLALARVAVKQGDSERAEQMTRRVLQRSREAGYRELVADSFKQLASLAHQSDDVTSARTYYRRGREFYGEIAFPEGEVDVLTGLVEIELESARFDAALEHLEAADRRLEAHDFPRLKPVVDAAHLAHAAGVADWSKFDRLLDSHRDLWLDDPSTLEGDLSVLELAGDHASENGDHRRASRVWELARELSRKRDIPEAADRISEKLQALPG